MGSTRRARWHHLLVFLGPAVIIYSLFLTWPLLDSLRASFFDLEVSTANGVTTTTETFVGFDNFNRLLTDPNTTNYDERLWNAIGNNIRFFAIFMAVQNPVALLLATLLTSRNLKGAAIYRTILFTPTTLSIVIIGWIWTLMLNPLWGVVNNIFKGLGLAGSIPKEGWLGSPDLALTVVALVGVWQYVGLPMILFLSALLGIDGELIDAARVDGASPWRVFWNIKFPLILPTAGIVTILTFVGNFSAFDNVYVMQGSQAGPDFRTDLLGTFFYRVTFGAAGQLPNQSMGTTIATMMFLIILTGVILYLFVVQRRLVRD
ncbi:MAG: ABC transporter permease subunit [Anaerolineaceae bacterium]|nr:ABC transporter permease subunit [Anaerolineaceae bacterium]